MHLIAEEGPFRGLIINFEKGDEWVIGRDPDQADFVLEDSTVSRKHLLCYRTTDGIAIKDLSNTNPILVNDQNIGEAHLLREGDSIKIGQSVFLYSEEPTLEAPLLEESPSENMEELKIHEEHKDISSKKEETSLKEENPKEEAKEEEGERYDTIFQEEVEGELPFDLTGEAKFILKVISGPNSGAEFGMEKGRSYMIGKDPNSCDIAFNDLSVSRQHAQIKIDEEGEIFLEDLGSKNGTLVNAVPIKESTHVSPQDLISLGTTSFLLIDKEKATETIYSPLPQVEIAKEVEAEKKEIPPLKDWKKQIIPTKYLVIAAALLIALFSIFMSFFSLIKSEEITITEKKPSDKIKDALKKFEAVQFSFNPSTGTIFLVGDVLTKIEEQELKYELQQFPFINKVENSVVVDEGVWKNMNDILTERSEWKGISIHSPKAGRFIAVGYIKSLNDAQKLGDYLNVNFPFLDKLENQVVIEDVLSAQINNRFLTGGFSGINFQLTSGELLLGGRYSDKKEKEFRLLLDDLKKLRGVRSIKNLALSTSEENARIDLTQKYKITGYAEHEHKKISVVANGQIVTLGDFLDGMEVISILPNVILLEKEGIKYKINYSR